MERVGQYEMFDRELFVIAVGHSDDVPAAVVLPCPYFACLVAWDARGASDDELRAVADRLTRAGCVYVCCWGPDCERVHDAFDLADLDQRPDGPYAMSTWHSREPLSEALWFLLACAAPDSAYFDGCRAAVGLTIGSVVWAAEVRAALAAPAEFSAAVLAAED